MRIKLRVATCDYESDYESVSCAKLRNEVEVGANGALTKRSCLFNPLDPIAFVIQQYSLLNTYFSIDWHPRGTSGGFTRRISVARHLPALNAWPTPFFAMPKVQLIDKVGNLGATGLAVAYFVSFFLLLIAGAAGPAQVNNFAVANTAPAGAYCATPSACAVSWSGSISTTKYNQMIWMTLYMARPNDTSSNFALANAAIGWTQHYEMDVFGDGNLITANASYDMDMHCLPTSGSSSQWNIGGPTYNSAGMCGAPLVFTQSFLSYSNYV